MIGDSILSSITEQEQSENIHYKLRDLLWVCIARGLSNTLFGDLFLSFSFHVYSPYYDLFNAELRDVK